MIIMGLTEQAQRLHLRYK